MDADLSQLAEFAQRLRALQVDGPAEIAKDAAPLVEQANRATAAAGTDAYGTPWASKKRGEGPPLKNAPQAISAVVSGLTGGVIVIVLSGWHVFHHRGAGVTQRQILPVRSKGLPKSMQEAIHQGARKALARLMGGR